MAQHDYVIANGTGAAVRSDLNNALAAIVSNNSGSTEPATTYAYQWWADTTANQLKLRNAANSAWIVIQELDGTMLMEDGSAATPGLAFASDPNTGFYRIGADQLGIATNGTAAVAVDASQRVGIGTTTAESLLTLKASNTNALFIKTADSNYSSLALGINSNISAAYIQSSKSGSGTEQSLAFYGSSSEWARFDTSGRLLVGTSSNFAAGTKAQFTTTAAQACSLVIERNNGNLVGNQAVAEILFNSTSGGVSETNASISVAADAAQGSGDKPGRLVFSTTADGASSPTERMRLNRNGVVGFLSTETTLASSTTQGAGTSYKTFSGKHSGASPGAGTETFLVWSNGNVENTNNSYGAISDAKLKENIVDATSQWSDIKALQVRNYNFKEGQTHTQIGLIAQEVELVSPGLVSESPDRDEDGNDLGTVTKSVNYSVLYMKAVKALQEAMERIEQLEASNTDLLARVSALESA